jgi:hypothetical protein
METGIESTRLYCVENSLWKRLLDYVRIMAVTNIIITIPSSF